MAAGGMVVVATVRVAVVRVKAAVATERVATATVAPLARRLEWKVELDLECRVE